VGHAGHQASQGGELFRVQELVLRRLPFLAGGLYVPVRLFHLPPQRFFLAVTLQLPVQGADTHGRGREQDHDPEHGGRHGVRGRQGRGRSEARRGVACDRQDGKEQASSRAEPERGGHDRGQVERQARAQHSAGPEDHPGSQEGVQGQACRGDMAQVCPLPVQQAQDRRAGQGHDRDGAEHLSRVACRGAGQVGQAADQEVATGERDTCLLHLPVQVCGVRHPGCRVVPVRNCCFHAPFRSSL